MDEEVLKMIDNMVSLINLHVKYDEITQQDIINPEWLRNFLESRILWVLQYTRGMDAYISKDER